MDIVVMAEGCGLVLTICGVVWNAGKTAQRITDMEDALKEKPLCANHQASFERMGGRMERTENSLNEFASKIYEAVRGVQQSVAVLAERMGNMIDNNRRNEKDIEKLYELGNQPTPQGIDIHKV
jgi:hypothetical protein